MAALQTHYDLNPEMKSKAILAIMQLWVLMDSLAVRMYPLLKEFSPVFTPQNLDVLRVPAFQDMEKLQAVQLYLKDRIDGCESKLTIFSDPVNGCLAERWYDDSPYT